MIVKKGAIARAVDQPDPKIRLYLLLGPDEGQARAFAARLLEALGAVKFALSAGELKANPALLVDEAAALSLFGERRLIWIEPATNDVAEAVEALLGAGGVESPVVAVAGDLKKSSPLLKLAEASPHAVAYTAYLPDPEEALRIVVDLGRRVGLKVSSPVAERVAGSCGNDQAVILRELEKLALFVGASPNSPRELEHAPIDAVGADSGEGDLSRLGDLALLGEMTELADAVGRLPAGGSEGIPAIRSLQRRLQMLAPARARVERGERIDAVLTSLGKAVFWKDKPAVEQMLRKWTAEDLAKVAERAGALERSLMFAELPEREALGEELLAIARKARSVR